MKCIHCRLHSDNYDKKWLDFQYKQAKEMLAELDNNEWKDRFDLLEKIVNCPRHKFL